MKKGWCIFILVRDYAPGTAPWVYACFSCVKAKCAYDSKLLCTTSFCVRLSWCVRLAFVYACCVRLAYVYACLGMSASMCVFMCVCSCFFHVCVCPYVRVCMRERVYVFMCVHVCVPLCVYAWMYCLCSKPNSWVCIHVLQCGGIKYYKQWVKSVHVLSVHSCIAVWAC